MAQDILRVARRYIDLQMIELTEICADESWLLQANLCDDIRLLAAECVGRRTTMPIIENLGGGSEIHPAPYEFTDAQIATDPILHFFHYAHLPAQLQLTSRMFCETARYVVTKLPRNAERTVALRKLLEAKDAAVRANLPPPSFGQDKLPLASTIQPELGEPVEVGGHDEDRDGPIAFSS